MSSCRITISFNSFWLILFARFETDGRVDILLLVDDIGSPSQLCRRCRASACLLACRLGKGLSPFNVLGRKAVSCVLWFESNG